MAESYFFSTLEDERLFHHHLCMGTLYLAPITFLFLRYVFPPNWGKTYQTLLGPKLVVPPRIGWCLFEIPNLFWAALCYYQRTTQSSSIISASTGEAVPPLPLANTILLGLFAGHYVNRAIVYPLTLNAHSKPLPLEIVLSANLYTTINGYMQSQGLCQFDTFPDKYDPMTSPQFWMGLFIFVTGVAINWQSDDILRNLRKPPKASSNAVPSTTTNKKNDTATTTSSNSHYVIPYGGCFRFVSCPHYFGEIIEWTGFAIASNHSLTAWSFVAFSAANLIPRAIAHHQWYLEKFPEDYPGLHRTAVIPFLW